MSACSRILVGKKDPINRDFLESDRVGRPQIVKIDSGHDMYVEKPRDALREQDRFLRCVSRES
jgi:hypothetical protein